MDHTVDIFPDIFFFKLEIADVEKRMKREEGKGKRESKNETERRDKTAEIQN